MRSSNIRGVLHDARFVLDDHTKSGLYKIPRIFLHGVTQLISMVPPDNFLQPNCCFFFDRKVDSAQEIITKLLPRAKGYKGAT